MKPKAFSYVRWSTDRQPGSLARQLELSAKYAAEHGLELDDSLRDEGVSAFHGMNRRRGDLGIFLEQVEAGIVPRGSYLLVESLDRISREQIVEAQTLFLRIINAGITLVTILPHRQTVYSRETINKDPTSIILAVFEMIRANEESAHKSERVKAARKLNREQARAGKTITKNLPAWISVAEDGRRVCNEKAEIVRRIFNLVADGVGRHSIVRMFNKEGVPGLGFATKWHASHIHHLLHGKTVLGQYQPHKIEWQETPQGKRRMRVPEGEPIEGYYEAAVSEDLYYRAHAATAKNRVQVGRKGTRFNNLLLGLTRCDACNSNMAYRDKGRKSVPQYACSGADRGICDNTRKYRHSWIEGLILGHVTDVKIEARPEQLRELDERLAGLLRQQDEIGQQIANFYENMGKGLKGLAPEIAKREAARDEIESEIAATRQEIAAKQASSAQDRIDFIRTVRDTMREGSESEVYEKRARLAAALREIVDQVVFYPEGHVDMIIVDGVIAYRFKPDGGVERVEVLNPIPAVFTRGSPERGERFRKVMAQVA